MRHGGRVRRPRLTPTIRQMMKLVVLGAAASLCLVPVRPWLDAGIVNARAVVLGKLIAMPLAMAMAAFLVFRRGPSRDRLVLALVMISLVDLLGASAYLTVWGFAIRGALYPSLLIPIIVALVIALLGIALYVAPCPCPRCRRSWLFVDGTFRPRPDASLRRAYRCGSCERRYWRDRGDWHAVPDERSAPIA